MNNMKKIDHRNTSILRYKNLWEIGIYLSQPFPPLWTSTTLHLCCAALLYPFVCRIFPGYFRAPRKTANRPCDWVGRLSAQPFSFSDAPVYLSRCYYPLRPFDRLPPASKLPPQLLRSVVLAEYLLPPCQGQEQGYCAKEGQPAFKRLRRLWAAVRMGEKPR